MIHLHALDVNKNKDIKRFFRYCDKMGRTYLAEAAVQQYVDNLLGLHDSAVGLIVGQMTASKDYIVHMVATPALYSEAPEGGDVEPPLKRWLTVDAIDEQYVTNHARQLTRMLTGGFDVIGLFACTSPDEWKSAQSKLRQSAGSPAEFKFQRSSDDFVQVQTYFSFSHMLPVPLTSMAFSLNKQILSGLQPVFKSIWNSFATVNGSLVTDSSETLVSRMSSEKTKRRPREDDSPTRPPIFAVSLIQDLPVTKVRSPTLIDCGAKMTIQGTVAGRACIHSKSSFSDALQALKRDIIRSIIARCELLCEDLLQAEEEQDTTVVYETPLRVFAVLPENTSMQFCDYLFPDETLTDSAKRFQDLVGIDVGDIDASAEHIPTETDLERVTAPMTNTASLQYDESLGLCTKASSKIYQYIGAIVSVVAVFVAAVVMSWYSSTPDV